MIDKRITGYFILGTLLCARAVAKSQVGIMVCPDKHSNREQGAVYSEG